MNFLNIFLFSLINYIVLLNRFLFGVCGWGGGGICGVLKDVSW